MRAEGRKSGALLVLLAALARYHDGWEQWQAAARQQH
jgi:hypothetical protein